VCHRHAAGLRPAQRDSRGADPGAHWAECWEPIAEAEDLFAPAVNLAARIGRRREVGRSWPRTWCDNWWRARGSCSRIGVTWRCRASRNLCGCTRCAGENPRDAVRQTHRAATALPLRRDQPKDRREAGAGRRRHQLRCGRPGLAHAGPHRDELARAARDPANHRYPETDGLPELRKAIARWYEERFGVSLDPDREVLPVIGSKEGIGHVALCFIDPGDLALVPDPGYPVYARGTFLAGGDCYFLPSPRRTTFCPTWTLCRTMWRGGRKCSG